jgi:hypothetical protein
LVTLSGWKVHKREERMMEWGRKKGKEEKEGKRERDAGRKRDY